MATIMRILTYEEWLQTPRAEDGRREVSRFSWMNCGPDSTPITGVLTMRYN
jgi:hypothetical protein